MVMVFFSNVKLLGFTVPELCMTNSAMLSGFAFTMEAELILLWVIFLASFFLKFSFHFDGFLFVPIQYNGNNMIFYKSYVHFFWCCSKLITININGHAYWIRSMNDRLCCNTCGNKLRISLVNSFNIRAFAFIRVYYCMRNLFVC